MARRSEGLSERHKKILAFLSQFQSKNGYSPSIREIGDSINVKSTSLIDYYLNQLEEMGYISREGRVSRSIRVLKTIETLGDKVNGALKEVARGLEDMLTLPKLGVIQAGMPIPIPASDFAYFDNESGVDIPRSLLPTKEKISDLYALEVQGDSMIDASINDGDIVIMRHSQEAANGEMVAVWLSDRDETTLKYFYKEKDRIRLQPANPQYKPIIVENPSALQVMGKVVMVIRQVQPIAA